MESEHRDHGQGGVLGVPSCGCVQSFQVLASVLEPGAVRAWLVAHGWELERAEEGVREIWGLPGRRARVMVPLAVDYVDFSRRFAELLGALGAIYGLDASVLGARIAAVAG